MKQFIILEKKDGNCVSIPANSINVLRSKGNNTIMELGRGKEEAVVLESLHCVAAKLNRIQTQTIGEDVPIFHLIAE
jgi:hypothetical protein